VCCDRSPSHPKEAECGRPRLAVRNRAAEALSKAGGVVPTEIAETSRKAQDDDDATKRPVVTVSYPPLSYGPTLSSLLLVPPVTKCRNRADEQQNAARIVPNPFGKRCYSVGSSPTRREATFPRSGTKVGQCLPMWSAPGGTPAGGWGCSRYAEKNREVQRLMVSRYQRDLFLRMRVAFRAIPISISAPTPGLDQRTVTAARKRRSLSVAHLVPSG
jgi:hypothetical protein